MSTIEAPEREQSTALFDKSQYDSPELALPRAEGHIVDKVAVKVTGTVFLDRSDPNDIALFRSITPGKTIPLNVEVRLNGIASKFGEDEDGNLDEVTGQKTVTVQTLYKPGGE